MACHRREHRRNWRSIMPPMFVSSVRRSSRRGDALAQCSSILRRVCAVRQTLERRSTESLVRIATYVTVPLWRASPMLGRSPSANKVEDKYYPGEPTMLGSCDNLEDRASRLEVFGPSKVRQDQGPLQHSCGARGWGDQSTRFRFIESLVLVLHHNGREAFT